MTSPLSCQFPGCENPNQNIWKVSQENNTPPIARPFTICHRHIQTERYRDIYNSALEAAARLAMPGDTISSSEWKVEKVIATWEQTVPSFGTCEYPDCKTPLQNVWKISSKSTIPPVTLPFILCHQHLQDEHYSDVYGAMVKARINGAQGNTLTHGDWKLEKAPLTWQSRASKCSERNCHNTRNLWKVVWLENDPDDYYPFVRQKIVCPKHQDKSESVYYGRSTYESGICPVEETWTNYLGEI